MALCKAPMSIYFVGTRSRPTGQFVFLGSFDTKDEAKKFIATNASRLTKADDSLDLYKVSLDENRVYSFGSKELKQAYERQLSTQTLRASRADAIDLSSISDRTDGTTGKSPAMTQSLEHQIAAFERAIQQLEGHPDLQNALVVQLDALRAARQASNAVDQ